MKILHVIEDLGPGGAEYLLLTLLPELKKNGLDCDVAALWPTYELLAPLESAGIVVHKLELKHRWNIPGGVFKLCKLLYRQQYDVVHAHLFFSTLYVGLSKFLFPGTYRVTTFHNLVYDSYPVTTRWKRIRWHIDRLCNTYLINAHIAVSEAVKQHYAHNLRLTDIQVINNCVRLPDTIDHAAARCQLVQQLGIQPDKFIVLMPGRLIPEKGHRYALEALYLLKREHTIVVLVIIGSGPLKQTIQADIDATGLNEHVIMCDALPQAELYRLMAGADSVLMASTHEGWGLIAAEANGLGRPLVATDVGGLSEVVLNGLSGMVVPAMDPRALAAALKQLMGAPDLRLRLGNYGRQYIRSNFSVDIIARKWVAYYQATLPDKPSSRSSTDPTGF